jgi:hypothetical protein
MTGSNVYLGVVVSVVLFVLWTVSGLSQSPPSPSGEAPHIGASTIQFGDDQITPNRFAIRAFVPTSSLSTKCLATLSESNFAVPGISVFCAPREFEGQQGVLFSAFFPQPVPPGLVLSATIYQEHALRYGAPVFFCGAGVNC